MPVNTLGQENSKEHNRAREKLQGRQEEMKERPILMQGWSVRAILDGRKTHTRRVIKHPGNSMHYKKLLCDWSLSGVPHKWDGKDIIWQWRGGQLPQLGDWIWELQSADDDSQMFPCKCLYGNPGDLLWVRETFCGAAPCGYDARNDDGEYWYRATDEGQCMGPWSPSIFMPKRAARCWLRITDIRVERVQSISDEDITAEGCEPEICNSAWDMFCSLWDSINAKRGYSWESNPWVWVVVFERVDR